MNRKKYRTEHEFLFTKNNIVHERTIILNNKTNQSIAYAKSTRMAKKICALLNREDELSWTKIKGK